MKDMALNRGGFRGRRGGGRRGGGVGHRGHRGGFRGRHHRPRTENRKTFCPEKSRNCGVCDKKEHKYRCPRCSVQYCSLPCFKDHKPDCEAELDIEDDPADAIVGADSLLARHARRQAIKRGTTSHEGEIELTSSSSSSSSEEDEASNLGDGNPDRLKKRDLKELRGSEELKRLLANPHLRTLILRVDGERDKNAVMHDAMQEPLFVEMVDACLSVFEKK